MRLFLFDIDGTLLHCGPQVRPWFAEALVEVYGQTGDVDGYDFGGKTDPQIVVDLMTAVGLERGSILERLPLIHDAYLDRLERGLCAEGMCLLPGVAELLERLSRRTDLALGLLTGNWERGARAKLGRFDLGRYFAFGGFGDDGIARADLVPAALARAERHAGRAFRPEDVLVIGDTVHDIGCAQAHGLPVLAVATGRTGADVLLRAGADHVVTDLREAIELLG